MCGGFDTLQVPLPGTPKAYKRDLEAKRKRSLSLLKTQFSAD